MHDTDLRSGNSTPSTASLTAVSPSRTPSPQSIPSVPSEHQLTTALQSANRSLSAALHQAQQAQLEIDRLTDLLSNLRPASPHQASVSTRRLRTAFFSGGFLCPGDHVRIRYPRDFQQPTGIAVSTSGRFICVRTPNGTIVRRLEHNLQFLRRPP